jgi:hypothetical protein
MLAKHKVGSSTLLTRSIFKPLEKPGAFLLYKSGTGANAKLTTGIEYGPASIAHRNQGAERAGTSSIDTDP